MVGVLRLQGKKDRHLNIVIRTEAGTTTHFYYNQQWQVLTETDDVNVTKAIYSYHPHYVDAVAVRMRSNDEHFFTHDSQYSVTSAINRNTGVVDERYNYSPYGEATVLDANFVAKTVNESDIGNEYLYTGRRRDPGTNLQLHRNRYYHAALGQWLNRDPLGYVDGMSQYRAYCVPGGVDPWGLFSWVPKDDLAWWWPGFVTEAIVGDEEDRQSVFFGHNIEDQNRAADDLALNKNKISDHCKFVANSKRGTPLAHECIEQLAEAAINHNGGCILAATPIIFTRSMLSGSKTIARSGDIDKVSDLVCKLAGKRRKWVKKKGWDACGREVHCYEHHGIGRRGEKYAGEPAPF